MTEQIGKITLDYKHYPGEDFYCDGVVEDELLEIVQNYRPEDYADVIEERASWPILYHLSPLRENIVGWIPFDASMKVLEVGSGCGAITGALAKKAGSVTCIDLSKKRSHINAHRHKECGNVTIQVGNFTDIEPELAADYDYICLIGVFEYGQSYIGTKNPFVDFLTIIKKHLKQGGRIIIAIENRFGLKYFAGCREDHLGTYFSGIEDYASGGGVRTFTKNGLEQILQSNHVDKHAFYYPYPDYKFMTSLYSDEYLPKIGELSTNTRNFDRDRMLLFDEKDAFDGILRDGLFPLFSNSYLLMIGEPLEVKYSKFSNDRASRFEIRTDILKAANGQYYVEKSPLTEAARIHADNIKTAYEMLQERYQGSKLELNRCEVSRGGLRFEYIEGVTLETLFDDYLDREDYTGFQNLLRDYIEAIDYHSESQVSDFDLIFSNILVQDDKWTIIDYEWTFNKQIPTKEIAYRAFYCYTLGAEKRRKLNHELIKEIIGVTTEEAASIREKEKEFQKYVTGQRLPLGNLHSKIGCRISVPIEWEAKYIDDCHKNRVQIYEDKGTGFSEETSYFIEDAYQTEEKIEFSITLTKDVCKLRIDPALDSCIVTVRKIEINGTEITLKGKKYVTNGVKCAENTFVFTTSDPNIILDIQELAKLQENRITVKMDISRIPSKIAEKFQVKKHLFKES